MTVIIDHVTLPAYNNEESAQFLGKVMGFST
jgi:hypothetical protein